MTSGPWKRKDDELDEEIRSHLDMSVRDHVDRGLPPADAEISAAREFGNVTQIKEVTREMWGWGWLERLAQDLRYAARQLRGSPGFTVVAVLSLSLGIGANTAIFQVLDAVRLRTLPINRPDELVTIDIVDRTGERGSFGNRYAPLTNPVWEKIRGDQHVLSGVFAWGAAGLDLAAGGEARLVRGLWVSGEFFDVLGVLPARGRLLIPADDTRGCAPRVVLSHAFWQREFAGDPTTIGRTLTLDGHPVEIVGVTPASFYGLEVGRAFDVAVPICAEPVLLGGAGRLGSGTDWWLTVMGRRKPGVTLEQTAAHLQAISASIFQSTLSPTYPPVSVKQYLGFKLTAIQAGSGVSDLREQYEAPLWLLLATAGLVLLIACANLANLLLARAGAREREIAVRLALGASRARLLRQLLSESVLLALLGAGAGALIARALSGSLVAFLDTSRNPVFLDLGMDWRVLGFTTALGILTCLLFGLAPALRATRVGTGALMKAAGRGLTASRERFGARRVLVAVQVALSLVLLFGALLFARSLGNLLTVDTGFRADGVVVAALDLRRAAVPAEQRGRYKDDLVARIRAVPGVESAAQLSIVPLSGNGWGNNIRLEGPAAATWTNTLFNRVGPGFFETLRIPLLAGRDFTGYDTASSERVAIVTETLARQLLNLANPLGRTFTVEATPTTPERSYAIVGLVRDAKYMDLREKTEPVAFLPMAQDPRPGQVARIVIRSQTARAGLTASVARAMAEVNPHIGITFGILSTQIAETLVRERLMATLSGFFGGVAALLAMVGLYGVIAYTVDRRTNEIGVRMALGASQRDVLGMVLREAGMLVAAGVVIGLLLALAGARAAASLLFGLQPYDPSTLAIAVGALATIALLASYMPARAATKIEPALTLRLD